MSDNRFQPIVVTTTSDQLAILEQIAQVLIDRRLAACVQIGGEITSYYRWQGKVECSRETRCIIKTDRNLYRQVEAKILELHNYDQPQIVVQPIDAMHSGYEAWMRDQLVAPNDDAHE